MLIRKIVPKPIKEFLRNLHGQISGNYWFKVLEQDTLKHAKHEVKRQKLKLLRPLNIDEPIYFSEKMFWLKYNVYNKSPLIAQCYNKYEVRKYVEKKGLGYILNELYGFWDSVDEIPWEQLPDEYVMKVSNGYAGHVFKRKGQPFNKKEATILLLKTKKRMDYLYKITGDLFVAGTAQKIICERLLHSNLGYTAPEDYKFYCFNGKPLYVEFMKNRFKDDVNDGNQSDYDEVFVDIDLNDRHELEGEASPGTFEAPPCYQDMIKIAEILSKDFPFVRVDLYVENEKPIFGELTFTPFHVQTKQSEVELGEALDLSKSGYKHLLEN